MNSAVNAVDVVVGDGKRYDNRNNGRKWERYRRIQHESVGLLARFRLHQHNNATVMKKIYLTYFTCVERSFHWKTYSLNRFFYYGKCVLKNFS